MRHTVLKTMDGIRYVVPNRRILDEVEKFTAYYSYVPSRANVARLLAEDLFNFAVSIPGIKSGRFWLRGSKSYIRIHLKVRTKMSISKRQELLELSSSGKNAAASGFTGIIREVLLNYAQNDPGTLLSYTDYRQSDRTDDDDLEKMILTKLSDEIKVGIKGDIVDITVEKEF